jgi:ABC transporter substrate binding protein
VRRREFITFLGGAAAAGSVARVIPATAQQPGKVPRVGILTPAENAETPIFDAFRKGLRDLGYIDGKTIVLDFRFAKGNMDALSGLAAELVRSPVDVIVVDATAATRAALDATRTIPIVIGASADPVLLGFVASIRRPGGNVTGMTIRTETLSAKRVFAAATGTRALVDPVWTLASLGALAADVLARAVARGVYMAASSVGLADMPPSWKDRFGRRALIPRVLYCRRAASKPVNSKLP